MQDLLSTVNKPEWPSSELLLSLLGRILVRTQLQENKDQLVDKISIFSLGDISPNGNVALAILQKQVSSKSVYKGEVGGH